MSCSINQSFVIDCRDNVGGIKEIKVKTFNSNLTGFALTSGQATLSGNGLTGWYTLQCEEATATATDSGTTSRENGTTMFAPTVNWVWNDQFVFKMFPDVIAYYAFIIVAVVTSTLCHQSHRLRVFLHGRIWV